MYIVLHLDEEGKEACWDTKTKPSTGITGVPQEIKCTRLFVSKDVTMYSGLGMDEIV